MRRATTPTHTFTFPEDVPVDELSEALITYCQDGAKVLEKRLSDVTTSAEGNTLSLTLNQAEATSFAPEKALVQIRVKTKDDTVMASQMMCVDVKAVLNSEEL